MRRPNPRPLASEGQQHHVDRTDGGSMADEEMGPVDYLVVEFPGNKMTGEGFPLLMDLVDRGIIRILDFLFVRKETDGTVTALTVSDLDGDGKSEFKMFAGAASGLLDDGDVADAASVIEPG